jgi:hypothetical protein
MEYLPLDWLTVGAEPPGGTGSPHPPKTPAVDPTNLASPLDSLVGSSDLLGRATKRQHALKWIYPSEQTKNLTTTRTVSAGTAVDN